MDWSDLPPLAEHTALASFPGAPFSAETIAGAAGTIRHLAGWHIAPTRTETLTLDHDGSVTVHLPSKYVTDVASVVALNGSEPRPLTGWRWSSAGMLEGRFPAGFRVLEVTFTHGYKTCPPDLLPVLAARAKRRVTQESLGARQASFVDDSRAIEAVISLYRLGGRP